MSTDSVAGRIVTQMVLVGHPATAGQVTALLEARRPKNSYTYCLYTATWKILL